MACPPLLGWALGRFPAPSAFPDTDRSPVQVACNQQCAAFSSCFMCGQLILGGQGASGAGNRSAIFSADVAYFVMRHLHMPVMRPERYVAVKSGNPNTRVLGIRASVNYASKMTR